MNGIELIATERDRQVESEGWTSDHDAKHTPGDLAKAGSSYASVGASQLCLDLRFAPTDSPSRDWRWPFDWRWWKPSEDPIRNLVKAGALIAAEIDRELRKRGQYFK